MSPSQDSDELATSGRTVSPSQDSDQLAGREARFLLVVRHGHRMDYEYGEDWHTRVDENEFGKESAGHSCFSEVL